MNIEYLLSLNEVEFYEYKTFGGHDEGHIVDEFGQCDTKKSELTIAIELYKEKQLREDLKNSDIDFYAAKRQYARCKNAYENLKTSQTKLNLTLAGKAFGHCKTRFETFKRLNK